MRRHRNAKECDRCGATTRRWERLGAEVLCAPCMDEEGDKLNTGFSMLGASDDSIEFERVEEPEEMEGVRQWF